MPGVGARLRHHCDDGALKERRSFAHCARDIRDGEAKPHIVGQDVNLVAARLCALRLEFLSCGEIEYRMSQLQCAFFLKTQQCEA